MVRARAGVAAFYQVAVPSQDRVRADQQLEPAQCRASQRHQQCREKRSVLRLQSWTLVAEVSLQDRELVA
ncbi:hypothetical protein ALI144C_00295 [Actinosynnema sp. ALI-1.44]|nr:hypothetical protein ALI144C_00295 [Actinosynnema sp. ALI-1.44]